MTYAKQTWTDFSTVIDKTHMDHIEDGLVIADGNASTALGRALPPSYGTTLPGSPVDGQEAILVDSVATASYTWRFRYNAGSTSTYKWEFIGGTPMWAFDNASFTVTPAGSWMAVPTPTLTVPRAGQYHALSAAMLNPNVAGLSGIGLWIAGSPNNNAHQTTSGGYWSIQSMAQAPIGYAAGALVQMAIFNTGAGNAATNRFVSITPVRVS